MSNVRKLGKGLRIVAAWAILGAILACGGGDGNSSSSGSSGSTASAGSFMIGPGFTPDPRTATGEAGGPFDASTRNAACRGWIGAVSDHTLHLTSAFTNLRVLVNSPQDTTLVIQLSNGQYMCNDDAEGRNPIVQGAFPAGIHRVYVGTFAQNQTAPYTIGVTEMATTTAASLGGAAGAAVPVPAVPTQPVVNPAIVPPTGATSLIQLNPGFVPDPHRATGTAGGTMDATMMTSNAMGCRGNIPATPQHTLMAGGNFANLRVMVSSTTDTTLVIRTPTGQWLCNDDGEGLNPLFVGPFAPGAYQIWVGTWGSNAPAPYTLGISELASVTPSSL